MSDKNKPPVAAFFAKFNLRGAIVPLVFLVVGILFIIFPEGSMSVICYVLGALMLAAGAVRLVFAVFLPADSRFADVIFACVILAVGILLVAAQSAVAEFVTVVLGIVLIIDAVLKIEENVVLRKLNPARWWIIIAVAAVCVVLGIAVVALSFVDSFSKALMIVAGVSMLFDSVCTFALLVYSAFREGVTAQSAPAVELARPASYAAEEDEEEDGDEEDGL